MKKNIVQTIADTVMDSEYSPSSIIKSKIKERERKAKYTLDAISPVIIKLLDFENDNNSNFFGDKSLTPVVRKAIDGLYALEGELRLIAYRSKKVKPTNKDLISAITEKSKAAIASVLNKRKGK